MDEEKLNISLRRFLKNVGINSQRLIEEKVRESIKSGKINSPKKININAKISCDDIDLSEIIDGDIEI